MTTAIVLASGALQHKTWWNPYVKGGLIALFAIMLFTGSAYLLLYTDVGSRLGFLLTASAFSGFFAVLTVFWITGQFPNGPLGSEPGWPVEEVVADLSESSFGPVRTIQAKSNEADAADAGQIKAALDETLTAEGPFKLFSSADKFLAVQTFTSGGGRKWPLWWSENPTYGAVEICTTADQSALPLAPPPTPECDDAAPTQWAIVVKDLGARRLPAFLFFLGSSVLFVLSLMALNRYEKDAERPVAGPSGNGEGPGGNGEGPADREPGGPEAEPEPSEPATA